MEKKLTELQKKFINEYIIDLNPEQAAIRAGYCDKNALRHANQLIQNPNIISRIKQQIKEQTKRLRIEKSYIIQKLLKVAEFSLEEEAVTDKSGNPTGKTKLRDTTAGMKALEMLCKHCGIADKAIKTDSGLPKINIIKGLDESKV